MKTKWVCITCKALGIRCIPFATKQGAEWHVVEAHLPDQWTDDDLVGTVEVIGD